MKTLLKWLVLAPIALALMIFALLNRQNVPVVLDPLGAILPDGRLEAPLFVVMLACGALGVIAGSIVTWFGQGRHRRNARSVKSEAARLLAENERLREQGPANAPALAPPDRRAA